MSGDPLHHHGPHAHRPTPRSRTIVSPLDEKTILEACSHCIHAQERGDRQSAKAEGWKVLGSLGIKNLSDIHSFDSEQHSRLLPDHIRKEIVKVFAIISHDLERCKRHSEAFSFACRAVELFPTPGGLRFLRHLCETGHITHEASLLLGLRTRRMGYESFLTRRFRIRLQPDQTITARCRSSDETRQLLQEVEHYFKAVKDECAALSPEQTRDRLVLSKRCLPYLRCALTQVGLHGTPLQLCEAKELSLSVEQQETLTAWAMLSKIFFHAYELRLIGGEAQKAQLYLKLSERAGLAAGKN